MNKTTIAFISLITYSSVCNVAWTNQTLNPNQSPSSTTTINPWRIGIGLAAEYINIEADLRTFPARTLGSIGATLAHTAKRLQPSVSFEFGKSLDQHIYLGLLTSWRPIPTRNTSRSIDRTSVYFINEFHINQYLDILAKPGYKITPCSMIYGLIGPSLASWSHSTSWYFSRSGTLQGTFKMDKKSLGASLGFGFEYIYRKYYAFSVDYCYHLFRNSSQTKFIRYSDDGVQYFGDLKKVVKPSFSTVAIRFTYFFNL